MYDVIVVGARCAGAPTAMQLARAGHKVLLVDRATFPSDIPHGHFIHRSGPGLLKAWGVLDRVVATGCPAVTTMTFDASGLAITGHDLVVDGVALGYAPRRSVLDHLLVEAAVEAGAELREGFLVEEFLTDGDAITGIRGRARGSATMIEERAKVTVGADGRHSHLARAVQAPVYEAVPTLTCWYFSYWRDVALDGLEVHDRDQRVIFAFPTNDDLSGIFIAWPHEEFAAVRADIEGQAMAVIDRVPGFAERVRAGQRVERFRGASDLPNFLRKPFGPGWALVGDAGCHKDPYMALGVGDAFRDTVFLAEALDAGLRGEAPLEEALAGYERRRNEATMADYQRNLMQARFAMIPEEQRLLRLAVRDDPEASRRLLMAMEGMIPPETFFNPANIQALMANAGMMPPAA